MSGSGRRVGLDLGGTKIYGVATVDGELVEEAKRPTPTGSVDEILDVLVDMARALGGDDLVAVGVGTPGVVDTQGGRVLVAPNLVGFEHPVELGPVLRTNLGVPVAVANDVDAAAFGEVRYGAARDFDDVLAVWLGTGVGGGLVLDGRLRTSPRGRAGEIGHTVVVDGGRTCGCGGKGHLEAYLGRRVLEQAARDRHESGDHSELVDGAGSGKIKSKVWRAAYDEGDEVVHSLLDEGFGHLATVVSAVACTVDLEAVVVGGGLGMRFLDVVIPRLETAFSGSVLGSSPPAIVAAELGDRSGALGVAALAAPDRA